MEPKAKEKLAELIKKTPAELRDHEIRFLRARSPYLKKSQKEVFKSVLTETKQDRNKKANKKLLEVEENEIIADEKNRTEHPAVQVEQVPYRDLQALAKGKGLKYVGVSREKLEKSIIKGK